MIDAILRAHSKKTVLIVGPHVYDIRERIQINGQFAPEKKYVKASKLVINHARQANSSGIFYSYLEILIAISFLLSASSEVDYKIIETIVGGRHDLTNTISGTQKYCVLTQIGLDHTEILGTTFQEIATEKAEIINNGSGVTALRQKVSVNQAFTKVADKYGSKISWVESTGNYEIDDFMIALNACKNVAERDGWLFDEQLAQKAISEFYIPGRFEKRSINSSMVILDGAHNPQKITALCGRIERDNIGPVTVILAMGQHKDYQSSLKSLSSICNHLIICEYFLNHPEVPKRPLSAEIIYKAARNLNIENVEIIKQPSLAIKQALRYNLPILVTGSFYLLGEIDKSF